MFVTRNLNTITITSLQQPVVYNDLLFHIYKGKEAGFDDFKIHIPETLSIFPNTAVPVCAALHYFARIEGIEITIDSPNQLLSSIGFINPLKLKTRDDITNQGGVLNKVWEFEDSNQVAWLVDDFKMELSRIDQFEKGVLRALDWCLNEVMDNVFGHSRVKNGFVMGQIHRTSKHVAFTVFDYGVGIFNTLRDSKFKPKSVSESIKISLLEGVTRDTASRQGNGLYGLKEMIRLNRGRLTITSSSGRYFFDGDREELIDGLSYISNSNGCTMVGFQLDYNNPIALNEILFRGRSYDFLDLNLQMMETITGETLFRIIEHSDSFGTRDAGLKMRNEILNIIKQADTTIILDFEGVDIVSSSFADELLGKLVVSLGFFGFNKLVKMKGMNPDLQAVVQRSVGQRMAEAFGQTEGKI